MLTALRNMLARRSDARLEQWLDSAKPEYTPDIARLQLSTHWNFFIYDEMMRRHSMHNELKDSEYWGVGYTLFDNFTMFKQDLGRRSSPIVLVGADVQVPLPGISTSRLLAKIPKLNKVRRPARIKGELFTVPTDLILELDKYNLNTVQFERVRVDVLVPCRKVWHNSRAGTFTSEEHKRVVRAFMYIGVRSYWDNLIDGGFNYKLTSMFTPNNLWSVQDRDYYYFSSMDVQSSSK
jgi:hypothetical protein